MTLRARLALLTAGVAVLVVFTGVAVARSVARAELLSQIDQSLAQRAAVVAEADFTRAGDTFGRAEGGFDTLLIQEISADGEVVSTSGGDVELPVTDADREVAAGERRRAVRSVDTSEGAVRVLTVQSGEGAVQVGRSLGEFQQTMQGITFRLLGVGLAGALAAGLLALWAARRAMRPIDDLTRTVEHVTATQDLDTKIDVDRADEVGRLATGFNHMMESLRRSRHEQERLVRDAGHELRTPLTALRTNVEMLARSETMDAEQRRQLAEGATAEIGELSQLVGQLVTLAADPASGDDVVEPVDLEHLAAEVVARFERRSDRKIELRSEPTEVNGRAVALERAISNLVDNALKWCPEDGVVTVTVGDGTVAVTDAGPGIADEDKPHVFERFYRSSAARGTSGSGLGLAIVEKVVDQHHGTVFVEDAPGGGATVGFRLPIVSAVT